jgi:hypothetical protein
MASEDYYEHVYVRDLTFSICFESNQNLSTPTMPSSVKINIVNIYVNPVGFKVWLPY